MKIDTYDILWQNCIKPAADEILSLYGEDCRKRFNWHIDETIDTRTAVYRKYQDYRSIIHADYFGGKKFDVHKIGACFARAIIEESPIIFSDSTDIPEYIALSNYWLGIVASIYIVRFFLYYAYREVYPEMCKKMKDAPAFMYPRTTPGHDLYLRGRVKTLAVNDGNRKTFDFLGYADMLFWIENYNRQILENTIYPRVIRPLKSQ